MTGAQPEADPTGSRRGAAEVSRGLRELAVQLSLLNHQVSGLVKLQDVDLDCLDIISRTGPLTPSALARQAGLHPATTTGVLDRLERAGWIGRERVATDRRAVHISFVPDRAGEILDLYRPMLGSVAEICEDYSGEELATIAAFLARVTRAGQQATAELTGH